MGSRGTTVGQTSTGGFWSYSRKRSATGREDRPRLGRGPWGSRFGSPSATTRLRLHHRHDHRVLDARLGQLDEGIRGRVELVFRVLDLVDDEHVGQLALHHLNDIGVGERAAMVLDVNYPDVPPDGQSLGACGPRRSGARLIAPPIFPTA